MHKRYFPACPVEGPIEPPVPFCHMVFRGAVPNKCSTCKHMFEGECTRSFEEVGNYLHLDHGPCGINGPTAPVLYKNKFMTSKVEIPEKCSQCQFLVYDNIRGLTCRKDAEKWGDFSRGLDWGSWEPDSISLQLPLPKVTTKELSLFAKQNDLLKFTQEYCRINPGCSRDEAKADFCHIREIFENNTE